MTKVQDGDLKIREFELQLRFFSNYNLWERHETPYPSNYGLNMIIAVL